MKQNRRSMDKIRFSIGAKLVTIISIIVLISLGTITALVSLLVREDLRITAEVNNFEVNRRSAAETEYTLQSMRSSSRVFMEMAGTIGLESEKSQAAAEYFFIENPQAAALIFAVPGLGEHAVVNQRFFMMHGIDPLLIETYREKHLDVLLRAAAGETVLLNAAPHFNSSILALFVPGKGRSGVCVLYYPENLNDTYGFGTNRSYLINNDGDLLLHSDFALVHSGVNVANHDFIRKIKDSSDKSMQALVETDFGFIRSQPNPSGRYPIQALMKNIKPFFYNCINTVCKFLNIDYRTNDPLQAAEEENVLQFVAFTKLNIGGAIVITSIEYNKVFEGIEATTWRNIYLTIAVLFISVMVIWFFAKTISLPLRILAGTANKIENGFFDVKLDKKGHDEIGMLTESFQNMSNALSIFGKFTNREIALKAMKNQIEPGGTPKQATILFTDIRSFTKISENFTNTFGDQASERIVLWLNEYLTKMVECVEKTGGAVDKFIGDAVMAHWGTATTSGSSQKDACRCVFAALMMRKKLYRLNKTRKPDDPSKPQIHIGCAINTGMVTAGQIGSKQRMEYTVIGDPVNLASRVESFNKPLGTDILITENTWHMVKDHFITQEMPSQTVKGKERKVRIFAVIGAKDDKKAPKNLTVLREILGIKVPSSSSMDFDSAEKEYIETERSADSAAE